MEQDTLKTLFEKIGRELGIQANLLQDQDIADKNSYGWAGRFKGVNWIFINLELIREHLNNPGGLRLTNVWRPITTMGQALFYVLVHEYTHLQDHPESITGLTDADYYDLFKALGDKPALIEFHNREPSAEDRQHRVDIHTENFYTAERINVYRCGRRLAELEEAAGRPAPGPG